MTHSHGQNKKILLVYDNPESCELLEHELNTLNFAVHTSKSLQTALMMIGACCKIGISYQWIIIHHNLQDLSHPDLAELQKQQRQSHFNIIYFHHAIAYRNIEKISNKNNYVIPFSQKTCFDALMSAIKGIISRKELLNTPTLQAQTIQRKPQVLLVEDNDIGRLMAKTLLENLNLEVTEICNGQEGLKALDHSYYDLLLTDIFMPVMNGLDMVRTIRNRGQHQLPIIVMSANAEANWAESFFAGADGFLVKPFDAEVLKCELEKWLPLSLSTNTDALAKTPLTEAQVGNLKKLEHFLDVQGAIIRVAGKSDVYWSLLRQYHYKYDNFAERLTAALQNHQRQQAIELIHNLRGAAGNLGAIKVELLAGKLEHDLSRADLQPDTDALVREHGQLIRNLNLSLFSSQEEEELPQGSDAELLTILQTLPQLLAQHKARQIKNKEERLSAQRWPEHVQSGINTLLTLLKGFKYQQAGQHLDAVLSHLNHPSGKVSP